MNRGAILSVLVLVCGCKDADIQYPPADAEVEQLSLDRVLIQDDIRGTVSRIAANDDRLLLVDEYADTVISVFDLDGELLWRQIPRGEGPGESKHVFDLSLDRDTAVLVDMRLRRLTYMDTRESGAVRSEPIDVPLYRVFRKSGSLYGVGRLDHGLLWRDGAELGEHPRSVERKLPSVNRIAWAAMADGKIALGYQHAGLVIMNTEGRVQKVVNIVDAPFVTRRLEDSRGRGVITPAPTNWLSYTGLEATPDHIYALYWGNTGGDPKYTYPDGTRKSGRHVHIYDWDGNLLRILELDKQVRDIAVGGGYLFGSQWKHIPEVYRWKLPDTEGQAD